MDVGACGELGNGKLQKRRKQIFICMAADGNIVTLKTSMKQHIYVGTIKRMKRKFKVEGSFVEV